jgi:hypothetical protein
MSPQTELPYGKKFETRRQAMNEVINWMMLDNHRRHHSTLGNLSPIPFGKRWHAEQPLSVAQ